MLESKVPTAEPIGVVKRKLIAPKMDALRNRDCWGAFSRRGLRAYHANIRALPLLHFGPIAMSQSEVRVKKQKKITTSLGFGLIEMRLKPARDCLSML
jgi:hypothetical protein